MALEDRCSPQSASSPPRLPPKGPQQTKTEFSASTGVAATTTTAAATATATAVLDMSLPPPVAPPTTTTTPAMITAAAAAAAALYQQQQQQLQHLHHLQQLQQLHQQQLVATALHAHPPLQHVPPHLPHLPHMPNVQHATSSPGGVATTIKEEEESDAFLANGNNTNTIHTIHMDEEEEAEGDEENITHPDEDDIDVDDVDDDVDHVDDDVHVDDEQHPHRHNRLPPPAHQQSSKPTLAFSISNILSDHFGGATPTHTHTQAPATPPMAQQQQPLAPPRPLIPGTAAAAINIFRPFEAARTAAATPSAFTRVDFALELSRHHQQHQQQQQHHQHQQHQQQQAAAAAAAAAMMLERANFLNCFNPATYPRIHEEIIQSRMRRNGAIVASQQQQQQHQQQQHNPQHHPHHSQHHPHNPHHSHSSIRNSTEERSALGSLCKAVSQIGQENNSVATSPHGHGHSLPSSTSSASFMASPPPPPPSGTAAVNASVATNCPSSSASSSSSLSSASVTTAASSTTSSSSASSSSSSVSSSSSSSASARLALMSPTSPQPTAQQQQLPSGVSRDSGMESSDDTRSETGSTTAEGKNEMWPAWVYCTRYSDRPSSGPRYRRPKLPKDKNNDEKRPRTAFSSEQLARLKREFNENRYLTERRRQQLSAELGLNEAQIKIWFQNKRAKIKKSTGSKNPLALQLMAQGLYNHTTVPLTKEEEELEMRMNGQIP